MIGPGSDKNKDVRVITDQSEIVAIMVISKRTESFLSLKVKKSHLRGDQLALSTIIKQRLT